MGQQSGVQKYVLMISKLFFIANEYCSCFLRWSVSLMLFKVIVDCCWTGGRKGRPWDKNPLAQEGD